MTDTSGALECDDEDAQSCEFDEEEGGEDLAGFLHLETNDDELPVDEEAGEENLTDFLHLEENEENSGEARESDDSSVSCFSSEWVSQATAYFVNPIRNVVQYTMEHPFIMTSAVIGAAGSASFAFWVGTGIAVQEGSYTAWKLLPVSKEIMTIVNGIVTQIAYTGFNAFFIHKAYDKLIELLPQFCANWRSITSNTMIGLLSAWAGLANGAIIYAGYRPLLRYGEITAAIPAINTWFFIVCSRFVISSVISARISNMFSQEARLQTESLALLERLKPVRLLELNQALEDVSITNENFDEILLACMRLMSLHDDPIEIARWNQQILKALKMMLEVAFAVMAAIVALASFMLFGQEGYIGLMLVLSVFGVDLSENTSALEKVALGFVPALVSGLFMGLGAYDFLPLLTDFVTHLYYHPRDLPAAFAVVGMNTYSATCGWFNVAVNTLSNNIFGLSPLPAPLSQTYVVSNTLAGMQVLFPAWIKEKIVDPSVHPNPQATPVERLQHWGDLRRFPSHRIAPETAAALRQLSLFNRDAAASSATHAADFSLLSRATA